MLPVKDWWTVIVIGIINQCCCVAVYLSNKFMGYHVGNFIESLQNHILSRLMFTSRAFTPQRTQTGKKPECDWLKDSLIYWAHCIIHPVGKRKGLFSTPNQKTCLTAIQNGSHRYLSTIFSSYFKFQGPQDGGEPEELEENLHCRNWDISGATSRMTLTVYGKLL
jgi:hypothetical protein